ncbi:tRNA (adenosine(37)-N6)-threonylcarbamoyltransferase complex dimerization subunit type 1 TsaB [Roseospirillum parvum]|uniref:tRNA threonylcarbamoyladenosine biosynthesis protein TsaB n=1 Tax=Roseospirillum parvum TaxID=83401 RepID=A0A1G8DNL0_9PROT|nr:tRNA (adenosine(37)-N6)-threonylcarbamoyltransferase complex dimerization subunit type 1 TsaB [Roseospirillum parvum]SDH59119.1 tRNA threonylcarbamoyladenosine biosynthesis protein TsaB [Roseospirillum parvum]
MSDPLTLALDTAGPRCAAAVVHRGAVMAAESLTLSRGHAEALAPLIERVAGTAGVALKDLERLGVSVGPGSFTGLRVGLAMARGLAASTGVPLVGVTVTAALAAALEDHPAAAEGLPRVVVLDARRGDFYLEVFHSGAGGDGPRALNPAAARAVLAEAPCLAAGDGLARLGEVPPGVVAADLPWPPIAALARLAAAAPPSQASAQSPPGALYLRPPDAVLPAHGGRLRP